LESKLKQVVFIFFNQKVRSNLRELLLYNVGRESVVFSLHLDTSTSIILPFFDPDLKLVYLVGRGENFLQTVEIQEEECKFVAKISVGSAIQGLNFNSKLDLNIQEVEVLNNFL
jgi:coronin-1A